MHLLLEIIYNIKIYEMYEIYKIYEIPTFI